MPARVVYDCRQIPVAMAEIVKRIENRGDYRCEYFENSETHDVTIFINLKNVQTIRKRFLGLGQKEVITDKPLAKVVLRRNQYFAWIAKEETNTLLLLAIIANGWEKTVAKGNEVTIDVITIFEEELRRMFDFGDID